MLPKKLQRKLHKRRDENSLRSLGETANLVDFSSNDYLGFSQSKLIYNRALEILDKANLKVNGATGSRLLNGNHALYSSTEIEIANFHNSETALLFNSGYSANIGLLSCVPQRGDLIFYDELCHASIREGIQLSAAKSYKFKHNDLEALQQLLSVRAQSRTPDQLMYLITESVFSMDGDQPDLKTMSELCKKYDCHLIVDEAHAVGVFGKGRGVVQGLKLEEDVFARIVTFGKGMGCHGAAVLGGNSLKQYLINFARSFIYTTGLPPHSVATIQAAIENLQLDDSEIKELHRNIALLRLNIINNGVESHFILSESAIHSCVIPDNTRVKDASEALKESGFDVKPILSPTVPKGQERLRLCLHSYNTEAEITKLVELIATFV